MPEYRLPTPGAWHETLDDIDPGARPVTPRRKRLRAVPRKSREPLAPWGGYYYWCESCDYCNTDADGQNARCPQHRLDVAADKSLDYRRQQANQRAQQRGAPHAEYTVTGRQLTLLRKAVRDLAAARGLWERAATTRSPFDSQQAKQALDTALRQIDQVVKGLPDHRGKRDSPDH